MRRALLALAFAACGRRVELPDASACIRQCTTCPCVSDAPVPGVAPSPLRRRLPDKPQGEETGDTLRVGSDVVNR